MKTYRPIKICIAVLSLFFSHLLFASILIPPPTTIEQYMDTSDVVVIGTIGRVVKVHTFYGYQENAAELERAAQQSHMSFGVPAIDYEIEIIEVLDDPRSLLSAEADSLILRVGREHSMQEELGLLEDMGTFVHFLSINPDHQTFGYYSMGHKINIDEQKPVYYFGGEQFDVLGGEISSSELISKVEGYNIAQ